MSTRAANASSGAPGGSDAGAKRKAGAPPPRVDDEKLRFHGHVTRSRNNGSGTVKYRGVKTFEAEDGTTYDKRFWATVAFHVTQCLADEDGTAWTAGNKAVINQAVAFDIRRGRDGRLYAADVTSHPGDGPVACVPVAGAMAE